MKIPVKFLNFNPASPDRGYWDTYFLEKIFSCEPFEIVQKPINKETAVIVIPARHNYDYLDKINKYINSFKNALLIIAGDEESKFEIEKIKHPNIKIWLMTPHAGKSYPNVDRYIGELITPHTSDLPIKPPKRTKNWFFAGQITHSRRIKAGRAMQELAENGRVGELITTNGFAQGIDPKEYIKKLCRAKVIPCPGGPATPDTFRFYEALEAGCIPIADELSTINKNSGYWELLFGENFPFPTYKSWQELYEKVNYNIDVFDEKSNQIFAWWQLYKRNLFWNLIEDLKELGVEIILEEKITAVIPTSPILSNPDTGIIETAIQTVRTHLPTCEIFITFDGVRPEQNDKKENYTKFIQKVLWKCNREWKNVIPLFFKEHTHQVGMMREALKHIRTPYVLYVEHDTPITPDCKIPFNHFIKLIESNTANLIRLHFEARIPDEHKELVLGEPENIDNETYIKTIQWSQRPHLASTEYYKRILQENFTQEAKTFIEDKMHGVVLNDYRREQMQGWNKHKIWIYHPMDGNIKRSYHLDGRGDEQKYSMTF